MMESYFVTLGQNANKVLENLSPEGIVLHDLKAIYYPVPKTATSTLLNIFRTELGLAYDGEVHQIPLPRVKGSQWQSYPNYCKFAVVRNPLDRILSCYLDKIVGVGKQGVIFPGFERYNRLTRCKVFFPQMTFEQFVSRVNMIPDIFADEHFRSQHRLLPIYRGSLSLDKVIKFENLEQELIPFLTALGIRIDHLPKWNTSGVLNDARDEIKINGDLRRKIKNRYKKDFRLLDYSFPD